jgi:hypothetical protein
MSPFDFWLILVGLAIGGGLVWLVMADLRRRDDDLSTIELHTEAAWIADTLRSHEIAADADAVEEVLRLHRSYLAGIPDEDAWATDPAAIATVEPPKPLAEPEPTEEIAPPED